MTIRERRAARQANRQERRAARQERRVARRGGCKDSSDDASDVGSCDSSRSSHGSSKSSHSSKTSHSSRSSHSSKSSCSSHSSKSSNCSHSKGSNEGGPVTYAMREKLLSFGKDFTIDKMEEGDHRRGGEGEPAFYVDNKIVRVRDTFNIRASPRGRVLYQVQERMLRVRDSMAIEDEDGRKVAEVKKRVIGVVRDNFVIKIRGDRNWQCHGSILEHDFTIKENGKLVAKVHKKWITPIKDRYFIDIEDSNDAALVLMVAVALDEMS